MREKVVVFVVCTLIVSSILSGCSSAVKQEDYDSLSAYCDELKENLNKADADYNSLSIKYDELQKEYDSYKESMSEYEGLAAAEAEARRIEAEAIAESEAAEIAAAEAEAALQAEAEAKAGYETGITYDQLARTPDEYKGKLVKFKGKVIQVIEGDTEIQIRLAVNKNYDTVILCGYSPSIVTSRVLEDDIITIYGVSVGLTSYQSTLGGNITIPAVLIDKIDQ